MRVLVTAGPTREALDPVRYLTNRSSGKMGYAMADAFARATPVERCAQYRVSATYARGCGVRESRRGTVVVVCEGGEPER